ncbi:4'-phosphopantetheinyl transferase family protein [Trinickia mobilis]|uniref:4'-phosphopantetheinyl transferase family protein n=1 Tax=Trinickia mobilis TaxID=2816356 RepID=UPI001A8F14B1|nr:4'-phosphopantetheinyl transferase superfamily protein [Trinickia mobilis]
MSTTSSTHRAFIVSQIATPRVLAAGVELRCVTIDMNASLDSPNFSTLSDDERARATRFVHREDALRHAAARAALREALGERIGVPAGMLRLEQDAYGRPRLEPGGTSRMLDFNISHAGSHALIAIAAGRRVGIDIEACDPRLDWQSLAKMVFSKRDDTHVRSLPNALRHEGFYRVWTAKEALLKAVGTGLAGGMTHFSIVEDEDREPAAVLSDHAVADSQAAVSSIAAFDAAWCPAPPGYVACVAWSRELEGSL